MPNIALVQLGYESNTFIARRAQLTDLAPDGWIAADTVAQRFTGTRTGIGGVLAAAAEHGAQVVPMDLLSRNGAFNAGGIVDGANDHRIVMAAAIAASSCTAPVTILGAEAVNKSYPGFWDDYRHLGGDVHVL